METTKKKKGLEAPLKCMIHCTHSNDDVVTLVSMESWETLLHAARIRNHQRILEISKELDGERVPFVTYHRDCRTAFTLKRELELLQKQSKMTSFTNPIYEEDVKLENEGEDSENRRVNLAELHMLENMMEELLVQKRESKMDIEKLNNRRLKLQSGSSLATAFDLEPSTSVKLDIKVGSLKGTSDDMAVDEIMQVIQDIAHSSRSADDDTNTRVLLDYFAYIGQPKSNDTVDFRFLESILKLADGNLKDDYGQTIVHEVARDWHPDFAYFLKLKGVKIDVEDYLGRTPLFVASAANNVQMVEWLVKNGADINHRTLKGEGQTPIHYAGKYDAVEVFDKLVELGADPLVRDDLGRTPFFVAAEDGHIRICTHFLDLELPTASYSTSGVSVIDQIIENLPQELAYRALNQFIGNSASKVKIYLNCLGKRRWTLLGRHPSNVTSITRVLSPDPFEIIMRKGDSMLVEHPVILQMLKKKNEQFASKYVIFNILLHILFTVLWTLSISYRVSDIETGSNVLESEKIVILIATLLSQVLTFVFIYKLYLEWKLEKDYASQQKSRLAKELYFMQTCCHPRWIKDNNRLQRKKDLVKRLVGNFWTDGWIYMEILCLLMACGFTVITIAWFIMEKNSRVIQQIRIYYSVVFVLVVWLRQNRCLQFHQTVGPFIAMLGECIIAFAQIGFLFFEFFIPYVVTFWLTFGNKDAEGAADGEYTNFSDTVYQIWLMSIIGDYDFDSLQLVDKLMSQILVGTYFLLVSIITINMYIALLSEAFARVFSSASASCYLKECKMICNIEALLPQHKRDFERYINEYCAPLTIDKREFFVPSEEEGAREVLIKSARTVTELNREVSQISGNQSTNNDDVYRLEKKFRDFQSKHTKESVKMAMHRLERMIIIQSQPLTKIATSTENIINYLKRKTMNL